MTNLPDLIGELDTGPEPSPELQAYDPDRLYGLTDPEARFVDAIMQGNTYGAAYLIAHPKYRGKQAYSQGFTMARRTRVVKAIGRAFAQRNDALQLTGGQHVPRLMDEIMRCALVDPTKAYNDDGSAKLPDELDPDTRAAIVDVQTEDYTELDPTTGALVKKKRISGYKFADKQKSQAELVKIYGLITEKRELTGPNGTPLVPEMSEQDLVRRIAFLMVRANLNAGEATDAQVIENT